MSGDVPSDVHGRQARRRARTVDPAPTSESRTRFRNRLQDRILLEVVRFRAIRPAVDPSVLASIAENAHHRSSPIAGLGHRHDVRRRAEDRREGLIAVDGETAGWTAADGPTPYTTPVVEARAGVRSREESQHGPGRVRCRALAGTEAMNARPVDPSAPSHADGERP